MARSTGRRRAVEGGIKSGEAPVFVPAAACGTIGCDADTTPSASLCEGDGTVDGPGAGHRQRDQVGRGALLRPRERVRHLRVRHDDAVGEPCEGDGASDGPVGPSSAWGDEAAGLLPFGTCASAVDTCGCDAAEPGVFGTTTASDGPGAAVRH
jgi:hypothetical protein